MACSESLPTAVDSLQVTPLRNLYWRQLIQVGIPAEDARAIAEAIAGYDAQQAIPNRYQKQLIGHYCTLVARARLWRLDLLLRR